MTVNQATANSYASCTGNDDADAKESILVGAGCHFEVLARSLLASEGDLGKLSSPTKHKPVLQDANVSLLQGPLAKTEQQSAWILTKEVHSLGWGLGYRGGLVPFENSFSFGTKLLQFQLSLLYFRSWERLLQKQVCWCRFILFLPDKVSEETWWSHRTCLALILIKSRLVYFGAIKWIWGKKWYVAKRSLQIVASE